MSTPELRLLTHNERAMLAAELAHPAGPRGERAPLPPTRKTLQHTFQVSSGSFERARQVVRHGTDALRTITASGRVRLTTAARVAQLPPEAQEEFVTRVNATGIDPRRLARPGWSGEHIDMTPVLTRREARYRWVQESALRVFADNLDALAMVISTADGLDPALTPDQAAHWRSDLVQRSRPFRQLMSLLKERSG